jgi:hypothetical protein
MNLELTPEEAKLIRDALTTWKNEPQRPSIMETFLQPLLSKRYPEMAQGFTDFESEMKEESEKRNRIATMLIAKIYLAEAVPTASGAAK